MENIVANEELNDETSQMQVNSDKHESESSNDDANNDDVVITEDDLIYEKEEKAPKSVSPYDRPGKWYVVHTQSMKW